MTYVIDIRIFQMDVLEHPEILGAGLFSGELASEIDAGHGHSSRTAGLRHFVRLNVNDISIQSAMIRHVVNICTYLQRLSLNKSKSTLPSVRHKNK